MKTYNASEYPYRGHRNATGAENRREWTAPGGITVVAERAGSTWRVVAGPADMIGRESRNIKNLRTD